MCNKLMCDVLWQFRRFTRDQDVLIFAVDLVHQSGVWLCDPNEN